MKQMKNARPVTPIFINLTPILSWRARRAIYLIVETSSHPVIPTGVRMCSNHYEAEESI